MQIDKSGPEPFLIMILKIGVSRLKHPIGTSSQQNLKAVSIEYVVINSVLPFPQALSPFGYVVHHQASQH
jgi:hypothetical protein